MKFITENIYGFPSPLRLYKGYINGKLRMVAIGNPFLVEDYLPAPSIYIEFMVFCDGRKSMEEFFDYLQCREKDNFVGVEVDRNVYQVFEDFFCELNHSHGDEDICHFSNYVFLTLPHNLDK